MCVGLRLGIRGLPAGPRGAWDLACVGDLRERGEPVCLDGRGGLACWRENMSGLKPIL